LHLRGERDALDGVFDSDWGREFYRRVGVFGYFAASRHELGYCVRILRFSIFLAAILFLAARVPAALVLTNDTMVTTWSDSLARSQFGQRQNFFLGSYFISYY